MRKLKFLLAVLALASVGFACGTANDPCNGFDCGSGFSCVLLNDQPTCSTDGTSNGANNGPNGSGETCTTTADCQTGLRCLPGLSGNLVCQ